MKRTPLKYYKGFTLIEILITMSVGMMIFGMGIVKYRQFNQRQVVVNVSETMRNDLRQAQSRALAGDKPDSCSALYSYRVTFWNPGSKDCDSQDKHRCYKTQAQCGTYSSNSGKGELKTFVLPVGYQFFGAKPDEIDFLPLGQGVVFNQNNTITSETITVRDVSSDLFYRICVTQGGDVKDCGYKSGSAPTCDCV